MVTSLGVDEVAKSPLVRSTTLSDWDALNGGLPTETPSSLDDASTLSSSLTPYPSSSTSDESGKAKVRVSFLLLDHIKISLASRVRGGLGSLTCRQKSHS